MAHAADAPFLPAIERSAGEAFRAIADLAWIADADDMSVDRYAALIAGGAAWVASDAVGDIAGFVCGEVFRDALHIWEMSVRHDRQQAGLGRRLLATATSWAVARRLPAVTLTTFREVAWNEPFYRRAGFHTLPDHDLTQRLAETLRAEVANGLPGERRCAMRLDLPAHAASVEPRHDLSPDEIDAIEDHLYRHNSGATGQDDAQGLGFVMRDEVGEMIAAAAGYSWARTSELKQMWVAEAHRGRGHARALLDAFVGEARRRGVRRIWVQSHDFQAPAFYEQAGFARMAEFPGWPDGHSNVILCKTLAETAGQPD
ncbi:GNAT family N-acetyltransferase [Sphingomonas sp. AR_OL41]|uniref:GNAT family N-acetyltransferase n=1 Tax=Sphingomonas sp. AR_OL41 TaxID=3042729 RepID=UPI00247FF9B2|nr:GNAT family N-acetyltransferase [Sphingomonas sp. AR_OL41]MDH7971215.1 GNAT family N-acetyltransferase [Sphingomonas sp. AR_OL41]